MPPTFLEKPEHKHHVAAVALIAIVVIVFVLALVFGPYLTSPAHVDISPSPAQNSVSSGTITPEIAAKKTAILSKVATVQGSTTLSIADKDELVDDINGDRIKQYGFTDVEIKKIIDAINK